MPAELDRLQERLQYHFRNPDLVHQAITHRSADRVNNERLEFLGDAVLGFFMARQLFAQFPDADEGELSRMRASLVNRETLAELARDIELGSWLQLGAGERKSGGKRRASILADALEAILAAVYLDGGLDAVSQVALHLYGSRIADVRLSKRPKDPKTLLQELLQARSLPVPRYTVVKIEGEAHNQTFTVQCQVALLSDAQTGSGKSKRFAEQDAAERVLQLLDDHDQA